MRGGSAAEHFATSWTGVGGLPGRPGAVLGSTLSRFSSLSGSA